MPKKGSAFKGTGRKLGTGEEVIQTGKAQDADAYIDSGDEENSSDEEAMRQAELIDEDIEKEEKREGKRKKDIEINMSSEEEDILEGEESEGNLSHEDADDEGEDYYEVIDRKGNCIRMLKGDDDDADDTTIEAKIQNDQRFEDQNQRRRYNMGMVINRATANANASSKVLDFSDTTLEGCHGSKVGMEPCIEGQFIAIQTKNGKWQYRELQEAEIKELDSLASDIKCSCKVCTHRRQNVSDHWTAYGRTESRSGLKRGMYKYGEGRVLGDGNE